MKPPPMKLPRGAYPSNKSGIDEACSKIWTVYCAEADKHDEALMESWTRDMKGVLLFAALFSATLTAFIVESYQTLKADPTDEMITLLRMISGQLSNGNVSAAFPAPIIRPQLAFAPTTSSVLCNTFWFLSLFLSLTCALLATFVEQWARGFTQKTDRHVSPVTRARILTYLHSGLAAFDMHTLVDLIPLLLHTSVMIFFAGLVAFLIPIHPVLVGVAAVWTTLVGLLYLLLTVLPIFRPDFPYWTPLSGILWRLLRTMETLLNPDEAAEHLEASMTGQMMKHAMKPSEERDSRDVRALCWTAESLTDGHGLEVFIEGIYDIIWSSQGRRFSYDHLVVGLLANPHTHLIPRIQQMFSDSVSNLVSPSVDTHRQVACLKSIWAIAGMSEANTVVSEAITSFDVSILMSSSPLVVDHGLANYLPSVRAILLWNLFRGLSQQTEGLRTMLEQDARIVSADTQRQGIVRRMIQSIAEQIRQLSDYVYSHRAKDLKILALIQFHDAWAQDILAIFYECQESWSEIPYSIFLRFLSESASIAAPYEFEAMCNTINMIADEGGPLQRMSAGLRESCERLFTELVTANIKMLQRTSSSHHIDKALGHLLSISHQDSNHSTSFVEIIVIYLTRRNSSAGLCAVFDRYQVNLLWPRIAARIKRCPPEFEAADYVNAIWELASVGLRCTEATQQQKAAYKADFELWVLRAISPNAPAYASTRVLVTLNILSALHRRHFEGPLVVDQLLQHPLICTTNTLREKELRFPSALTIRSGTQVDGLQLFRAACIEAHISALTDFLEACSSSVVPDKAADTLACIAFPDFPHKDNFNRHRQIDLARAVQRVVQSQKAGTKSDRTLIAPLISLLNRSIVNVFTDLSAWCAIEDAIVEAEEGISSRLGSAAE
ncbi:hypothetical protein DFH06DRAFT_1169821 [Mycena polygramma]|nr:hypothetical protein DFH06DRAFT_1169821 [Mycena polygramma]